ncbi:hypothetical protein [uncultured Desulfobacter sp.]|uniref:hypothetical protein n=1 Tax=uncultured Desulfobacter sp. TaxID=240139 RepID=UPI0029C6B080|nr:hypothetical protein [uncultured Desulfobacter sp.]
MLKKLTPQLTLVSHYGKKPDSIVNMILLLQDKISRSLGSSFRPYELEQVHGTIIGLKCIFRNKKLINEYFKLYLNKEEKVNIEGFLNFVQSDKIGEIVIQVGGWQANKNYKFESSSQHPYFRSFLFQNKIAVAFGWPVENGIYSESLYNLRKKFEKFKFYHKHNKYGYKDNDFYFVLGRISKARISPMLLQQTEEAIRLALSKIKEKITINKDTLSIVAHVDNQLPIATSEAFCMNDKSLNSQLLEYIYKQFIIFRK